MSCDYFQTFCLCHSFTQYQSFQSAQPLGKFFYPLYTQNVQDTCDHLSSPAVLLIQLSMTPWLHPVHKSHLITKTCIQALLVTTTCYNTDPWSDCIAITMAHTCIATAATCFHSNSINKFYLNPNQWSHKIDMTLTCGKATELDSSGNVLLSLIVKRVVWQSVTLVNLS